MNAPAPWYNVDRVSQSGSVILQKWKAEREASRLSASIERGNKPITQEDLLAYLGGGASYAGPAVNERTAMNVGAVYACIGLVSGAISSMPLPVYQRTNEGRERADHEYWWLFNEQAHEDWDAATFWEYVVAAKLLYGDAYAELIRPSTRSSRVEAVLPLHPANITARKSATEGLYYEYCDPDTGSTRIVLSEDMLHFKGLGFDGKKSLSPIRFAAKQTVGMSLAATEYTARFFSNGARPDFALTTESNKLTEEQARILRTTWMDRYGGASNSHLPAVLTGGMQVKELTMSAEDTQLIQTLGWTVEEIARVYGVPPHMIGHTDKATSWGSGIEQMSIGFVKYTLQRHLKKFEQEINRKLWPNRARYFVEFNTAGLERGDYKTRMEGYRIGLGRAGEPGWLKVNEVRKLENLPPVEGGDTLNNGSTTNAQTPAAA